MLGRCGAAVLAMGLGALALETDGGRAKEAAVKNYDGACTAMSMAKGAMEDDSVISTQTVDCLDCDFRQAAVPRAPNTEATERRKVLRYHPQYPGQISDRSPTWKPENLEDLPQKEGWLSEEWDQLMTVGYLPLGTVDKALRDIHHRFHHEGGWVESLAEPRDYLFGSLESQFGLVNEKQVGIGETTCAAAIFTTPRPCPDCDGALVDLTFLSRIALERCDSARCAVELMGLLAERLGYWPAEAVSFEGGEALSVSDKDEVWVFHILADDRGTSAVWAAQRVPDGHITSVANEFIIREVPDAAMDGLATASRDATAFDASQEGITDVFRASGNLRKVAERSGLLAEGAGGMVDFLQTFGDRDPVTVGKPDKSNYSTLRRWRVFTLAAPHLAEPGGYLHQPHVNYLGDGQPFSVPVAKPLSLVQVMDMQRDLYDGTAFDLRKGVAAGPWGDPSRYDGCINCPPETHLVLDDVIHGSFPRAISMYRTSSSFITVSRASKPDALVHAWIGQYAPHAGAYAPIYVLPQEVPRPLMTGSLFQFDASVMYWAFASVGNYARLMFVHMEKDIKAEREVTEGAIRAEQAAIEEKALTILEGAGDDDDEALANAGAVFVEYQNRAVDTYVTAWAALFQRLLGKYHDGMIMHPSGGGEGRTPGMLGSHAIWMQKMFYPKEWLEAAGYNKSIWPEDPPGTPSGLPPHAAKALAREAGGAPLEQSVGMEPFSEAPTPSSFGAGFLGLACGFVGAMIGFIVGKRPMLARRRSLARGSAGEGPAAARSATYGALNDVEQA